MVVHAHPDDEVISTGGLLAKYSDAGIRTVLVVCTNGEQGDGPGGVKPGEDGHDEVAVREQRLAELRNSVAILGVTDVELLGYHDSGMDGWDANKRSGSFQNVPLDEPANRIVELMEKYRPQVMVTYDEKGGYGHPDHIKAHQSAVAAFQRSGIADKLYYSAIPRSAMTEFGKLVKSMNPDLPDDQIPGPDFGTPDELVTTSIDTSAYVDRKVKALAAHVSQTENIFFFQLPEEVLAMVFGRESFIRQHSTVEIDAPETDLFTGLA
jgi:LmbE family N-acetylglucosaminyl deacetylase